MRGADGVAVAAFAEDLVAGALVDGVIAGQRHGTWGTRRCRMKAAKGNSLRSSPARGRAGRWAPPGDASEDQHQPTGRRLVPEGASREGVEHRAAATR